MMEDDENNRDDWRRHIPQGNSPYRRGLWAEAYHWVCWLLSMFGDLGELRVRGLSRATGLRLSNWLWGMEGAVRRLIIAAALAMDPKDRPEAKEKQVRRKPPKLCNRRPVFRVFCLRRAADGPSSQLEAASSAASAPEPYGHIPYPSDPLLVLGEARRHAVRARGPRQPNPLDRRGRLTRRDPDWRPGETGPQRSKSEENPSLRPHCTRKPPEPHMAQALPASLWDWRRVQDEWKKVIPAPSLAARIFALQRVVADPEALIARTAQRLQTFREQAAALIKQALPLPRQPRRARVPLFSDISMLAARCHGAIFRPDTS
jgi:hypothetical protein